MSCKIFCVLKWLHFCCHFLVLRVALVLRLFALGQFSLVHCFKSCVLECYRVSYVLALVMTGESSYLPKPDAFSQGATMYCVSLIPQCTHAPIWMYLKVGGIVERVPDGRYWPAKWTSLSADPWIAKAPESKLADLVSSEYREIAHGGGRVL